MNSPDGPLPTNYDSLTIQRSASIFRNTLVSVLGEESPFASAPFLAGIAEKYLEDRNQSRYFTTEDGFGANVVVHDGIAEPNIDLNIKEGLKSRNLRQRIAIRLAKDNPTDEEIFKFAVGHELGHLIQGLADFASIDDQDTSGLTESQIYDLNLQVNEYNESVRTNEDIRNAQDYFRAVFRDDIVRDNNEASIDATGYTEDVYLNYVNSSAEANADFISLWIMGMENPDLVTSPQNEGYRLNEWRRWVHDHRIEAINLG